MARRCLLMTAPGLPASTRTRVSAAAALQRRESRLGRRNRAFIGASSQKAPTLTRGYGGGRVNCDRGLALQHTPGAIDPVSSWQLRLCSRRSSRLRQPTSVDSTNCWKTSHSASCSTTCWSVWLPIVWASFSTCD